jgi:hypothetical protein
MKPLGAVESWSKLEQVMRKTFLMLEYNRYIFAKLTVFPSI